MGDAGGVTDTEGPYGTLIDTQLRVLTWNIWWRFGPWEARRPAIAATLARLDADVICLQEVWEEGDVSFAEELAAGLGFHPAFGARLDIDGVRFGNAVLSRWPIVGSDVLALPADKLVEELRTCVRADIDGPRGPLQVFSTHLNWRFDQSATRQDQVRSICRFIASSRPEEGRAYPPILCGDFNAEPESDEIRFLSSLAALDGRTTFYQDAWRVAGDGTPGFTQDWRTNPIAAGLNVHRKRIDYVFVGDPYTRVGNAGRVLTAELAFHTERTGVMASDHAGLVVDIVWPHRPG